MKAHHALVEALRAGDGAAAKTALAMDINNAAEIILSEPVYDLNGAALV